MIVVAKRMEGVRGQIIFLYFRVKHPGLLHVIGKLKIQLHWCQTVSDRRHAEIIYKRSFLHQCATQKVIQHYV